MIDIIMLADCNSKDNRQMTDRAIRSHLAQNVPCHVYLIESSGVKLKVKSDRVTLIQPQEKFNYNRYLQIALAAIDKPQPYVLISNNDVIAEAGCFDALLKTLHRFHSCSPIDRRNRHHRNIESDKRGWVVTVHVCGWAICFRRSVLQKIAPAELFPVELGFWYQDNFYADALKFNGFVHALSGKAKLFHLDGQSHGLIPKEKKHALTHGLRDVYTALLKKRGWAKK